MSIVPTHRTPSARRGITETKRIAALAYACDVPFAPHIGFSGAVCVAATLQLCAAVPNFLTFECMTFPNPSREELSVQRVGDARDLVAGAVPLPAGPGLGMAIDAGAVQGFRMT
jgi:galactonate dehydratase